jgi:hypothetical protein
MKPNERSGWFCFCCSNVEVDDDDDDDDDDDLKLVTLDDDKNVEATSHWSKAELSVFDYSTCQ